MILEKNRVRIGYCQKLSGRVSGTRQALFVFGQVFVFVVGQVFVFGQVFVWTDMDTFVFDQGPLKFRA